MKDTKAIIIAAGKSTRTHPLTITRPKPLLPVANKTLLEHNLDNLQGLVSEAILVVGYKADLIKECIGDSYKKIKITYVIQEEQKGTGHALLCAKSEIGDRFVVLMGDNFYSKEDIKECLGHEVSLLTNEFDNPSQFGVCYTSGDFLKKIVEKPKNPESNLINSALYVLDSSIFTLLESTTPSERGELELTDAVNELAKTKKVRVVTAKLCLHLTFSWNLLDLNSVLLESVKGKCEGKIEKNTTLKGEVVVGEGTVIRSGVYIEGPVVIGKNCTIGPNCYIRPSTSIGDGCKVGNAVEIKNSILFNNVSVGHLSYVGDSVLGEGTNFGAGTITANLKHDNSNICSGVKGEITDTGRRKLGTMVGDGVHTGINTSIYPGRNIFPGASTLPGEVVSEDKHDESEKSKK